MLRSWYMHATADGMYP